MQSLKELLSARSQQEEEKNKYHDLFKWAVYYKIHPSHWQNWVKNGWITLQDWFGLCQDKAYWQDQYPHIWQNGISKNERESVKKINSTIDFINKPNELPKVQC